MADEMTRQEFAEHMKALEQRLDARFDDLKHSMAIQFEHVRSDIRFSLEAVTGLREATDRGFDDMRAGHANHTSLLEESVRHVRRRLEKVEAEPGARKRR